MDKALLLGIILSATILGTAYLLSPAMAGREMNIPPTNAFSRIITDNGVIEATEHNDYIDMRTIDSVNVTMNGKQLYFSGVNGTYSETNSFGTVIINGESFKALMPNSTISINMQGSITCTKSGDIFNCKLEPISCGLLQGIKGVDASGNLFCAII